MRRLPSGALIVILLTIVAACGPRHVTVEQQADRTAALQIRNNSWLEMRIYAVVGGQRSRLGQVSGNSTATMRIPAHVVGGGRELVFLADPVGSPVTAQSFSIFVRPNETVTLTIPAQVR